MMDVLYPQLTVGVRVIHDLTENLAHSNCWMRFLSDKFRQPQEAFPASVIHKGVFSDE